MQGCSVVPALTHTHAYNTHIPITHMRACTHTHTHTHIHTHTHTHIQHTHRTHTYTQMHILDSCTHTELHNIAIHEPLKLDLCLV